MMVTERTAEAHVELSIDGLSVLGWVMYGEDDIFECGIECWKILRWLFQQSGAFQ